jgi:hypothetical protein
VPFFTAFTSPIRRASVYRRPRVDAMMPYSQPRPSLPASSP